MYCQKCGQENPDKNHFCKRCGAPLAQTVIIEKRGTPVPAVITIVLSLVLLLLPLYSALAISSQNEVGKLREDMERLKERAYFASDEEESARLLEESEELRDEYEKAKKEYDTKRDKIYIVSFALAILLLITVHKMATKQYRKGRRYAIIAGAAGLLLWSWTLGVKMEIDSKLIIVLFLMFLPMLIAEIAVPYLYLKNTQNAAK